MNEHFNGGDEFSSINLDSSVGDTTLTSPVPRLFCLVPASPAGGDQGYCTNHGTAS
jgi:hypothetical protein